jgi:hypothetical protein
MVDVKSYLNEKKDDRTLHILIDDPSDNFGKQVDPSDLRSPISDCQCLNCKRTQKNLRFSNIFELYDRIGLARHPKQRLSLHKYLLCPKFIPAFAFRTRRWGTSSFFIAPKSEESLTSNCRSNQRTKLLGSKVQAGYDRHASYG